MPRRSPPEGPLNEKTRAPHRFFTAEAESRPYLRMIPQAIFVPELPEGCVVKSSGLL